MANVFKPRKIPSIRKIAALLRLDRLHRAIVAFEENAFAGGLVFQRQPVPALIQARELLNEIELAHFFECRESGNFLPGQPHLSRPPATGRAALAFKKNRHGNTLIRTSRASQ